MRSFSFLITLLVFSAECPQTTLAASTKAVTVFMKGIGPINVDTSRCARQGKLFPGKKDCSFLSRPGIPARDSFEKLSKLGHEADVFQLPFFNNEDRVPGAAGPFAE